MEAGARGWGRAVLLLAPAGWSFFSSECWDIKQTFYNPLVLAASFCIPGGGTPELVGNRSIMGVSQMGCLPRAGGQLPLWSIREVRLREGSRQQKPLGVQCQLPPALVPNETNVLSTGALVVMDGAHPSISLKRRAHARGSGGSALPGPPMGA